jgi:hypothetical protein
VRGGASRVSAPPVRIESKAWTDHRYTTLALELGLAAGEADVALIRCAAIWRWQTEHYTDAAPTYVVDRSVVNGALKSLRGADAMVAATLAETQADGRLRIKGGVDDKGKSRIDWLYRDREKQREKGRRRHEQAGDRAGPGGGRFQPQTSQPPAANQPEGVQPPATDQPATSSPDSGLCSTSDSSFSFEGRDTAAREVLSAFLVALNHHRTRIRPTCEPLRKLTPFIGPASPEGRAIESIGRIPEGDRYRLAARALEVLVFQVEAGERDFGDLRPAILFGPAAFDQLVAAWPPSARVRAGPPGRSRSSDGTTVGRAEPAVHTSTEAIDPKEL